MAIELVVPTKENIAELRARFFKKLEQDGCPCQGGFHPADIDRIENHDYWLNLFLEYHDLDQTLAMTQLWETCEWRKTYGTNDITEKDVRMEYLKSGVVYRHGHDIDGKNLLIFNSKLHKRGERDMDELRKMIVFLVEEMFKENRFDQIAIMFDMAETGLQQIDLDYIKNVINLFKFYYPRSLNYIIILEMQWILNAAFKVVKQLLPAKAIDILRIIKNKELPAYIQKDDILKAWGGDNPFEFEYIPSSLSSTPPRKVHFAAGVPDSPISEMSYNPIKSEKGGDGEMLRITPHETILFTKSGTSEYVGTVEITNVDENPVTYKIKTTSPDKYRVRPSNGFLLPNASVAINVVLQQEHQLQAISRDKFLVMCMTVPSDVPMQQSNINDIWKATPPSSSAIESHRLRCSVPAKSGKDINQNGNAFGAGDSTDRQVSRFQSTLSQLSDTTARLENQIKFNQTLQWITLAVFLLLSMAVVYILKIEIKNSSSEHCVRRN